MKSTTLWVLIIFQLSFFCQAQTKKVYTWKDKNGVLVFSDTPKPGAKEVKLNTQNIVIPATDTSILDETKAATPVEFKVVIVSPADQATVRENTGSVYVTTRIMPRFANGFKAQLLFDGNAQAAPSNSTTFALSDVNRGEHTLQVKLYDPNDKLVSISPVSTFYMHRASVINN